MIEAIQKNNECCGKSVQQAAAGSIKNTPTLYIFMSFSVPKQVWQELWKQSGRHPFQFVLRGLPENSFQKLAEKIKEYGCPVSINPDLFEKFGVTHVPTFVWVQGKTVRAVQGNVSLDCALQHLGAGDP